MIMFCRFVLFFFLFFFFYRQHFSAVSRPICTKFGTNMPSGMRIILNQEQCGKLKNQVTMAKKPRKICIFFNPITFSLVMTITVKLKKKHCGNYHKAVTIPFRKCICDSSEPSRRRVLGSSSVVKVTNNSCSV